MSGRDMCYPLPELQQWESAQVAHYVWGAPGTVDGLGTAMDTAGAELTEIADSLKGVDVSGFWTGPGAEAFTALRDRVEPAVRGLGSLHRDAGAALGTWQRHLAVYQEDCGTAISTGRQGWQLYRATSCTDPDAQAKMNAGRSGITNATGSRDGSGRTCRTALEAAVAAADVPTAPPAQNPGRPVPISTTPGQRGQAPSGQEPVPAPPPYAAGLYVDPANGRLVQPVPGPWAIGRQPWEYTDGATSPVTPPASQPAGVSTPAANPPQAPSGQAPVPFPGPIPSGEERPLVDPSNGRIVVPVTGVYPPGEPWPYIYADG